MEDALRRADRIRQQILDIERRLDHVANVNLVPSDPDQSSPDQRPFHERCQDLADPYRLLPASARRRLHDQRRKTGEAQAQREPRMRPSRPAHRHHLYFNEDGEEVPGPGAERRRRQERWEPAEREDGRRAEGLGGRREEGLGDLGRLPVSHFLAAEPPPDLVDAGVQAQLSADRRARPPPRASSGRPSPQRTASQPRSSQISNGSVQRGAARRTSSSQRRPSHDPPSAEEQRRLARVKAGLRERPLPPPSPPQPRSHSHTRPRPLSDQQRLDSLKRQHRKALRDEESARRPAGVPRIELPSDSDADSRVQELKRLIHRQDRGESGSESDSHTTSPLSSLATGSHRGSRGLSTSASVSLPEELGSAATSASSASSSSTAQSSSSTTSEPRQEAHPTHSDNIRQVSPPAARKRRRWKPRSPSPGPDPREYLSRQRPYEKSELRIFMTQRRRDRLQRERNPPRDLRTEKSRSYDQAQVQAYIRDRSATLRSGKAQQRALREAENLARLDALKRALEEQRSRSRRPLPQLYEADRSRLHRRLLSKERGEQETSEEALLAQVRASLRERDQEEAAFAQRRRQREAEADGPSSAPSDPSTGTLRRRRGHDSQASQPHAQEHSPEVHVSSGSLRRSQRQEVERVEDEEEAFLTLPVEEPVEEQASSSKGRSVALAPVDLRAPLRPELSYVVSSLREAKERQQDHPAEEQTHDKSGAAKPDRRTRALKPGPSLLSGLRPMLSHAAPSVDPSSSHDDPFKTLPLAEASFHTLPIVERSGPTSGQSSKVFHRRSLTGLAKPPAWSPPPLSPVRGPLDLSREQLSIGSVGRLDSNPSTPKVPFSPLRDEEDFVEESGGAQVFRLTSKRAWRQSLDLGGQEGTAAGEEEPETRPGDAAPEVRPGERLDAPCQTQPRLSRSPVASLCLGLDQPPTSPKKARTSAENRLFSDTSEGQAPSTSQAMAPVKASMVHSSGLAASNFRQRFEVGVQSLRTLDAHLRHVTDVEALCQEGVAAQRVLAAEYTAKAAEAAMAETRRDEKRRSEERAVRQREDMARLEHDLHRMMSEARRAQEAAEAAEAERQKLRLKAERELLRREEEHMDAVHRRRLHEAQLQAQLPPPPLPVQLPPPMAVQPPPPPPPAAPLSASEISAAAATAAVAALTALREDRRSRSRRRRSDSSASSAKTSSSKSSSGSKASASSVRSTSADTRPPSSPTATEKAREAPVADSPVHEPRIDLSSKILAEEVPEASIAEESSKSIEEALPERSSKASSSVKTAMDGSYASDFHSSSIPTEAGTTKDSSSVHTEVPEAASKTSSSIRTEQSSGAKASSSIHTEAEGTHQSSSSVPEAVASEEEGSEEDLDVSEALPTLAETTKDEDTEAEDEVSEAEVTESGHESSREVSGSLKRRPSLERSESVMSEASSVEGRVSALRADLASKRETANRLKSEYKRKSSAHLRATEDSLAKQIRAYDKFIAETSAQMTELERPSPARPSTPPRIMSPRVDEDTHHHQLSPRRKRLGTPPSATEILPPHPPFGRRRSSEDIRKKLSDDRLSQSQGSRASPELKRSQSDLRERTSSPHLALHSSASVSSVPEETPAAVSREASDLTDVSEHLQSSPEQASDSVKESIEEQASESVQEEMSGGAGDASDSVKEDIISATERNDGQEKSLSRETSSLTSADVSEQLDGSGGDPSQISDQPSTAKEAEPTIAVEEPKHTVSMPEQAKTEPPAPLLRPTAQASMSIEDTSATTDSTVKTVEEVKVPPPPVKDEELPDDADFFDEGPTSPRIHVGPSMDEMARGIGSKRLSRTESVDVEEEPKDTIPEEDVFSTSARTKSEGETEDKSSSGEDSDDESSESSKSSSSSSGSFLAEKSPARASPMEVQSEMELAKGGASDILAASFVASPRPESIAEEAEEELRLATGEEPETPSSNRRTEDEVSSLASEATSDTATPRQTSKSPSPRQASPKPFALTKLSLGSKDRLAELNAAKDPAFPDTGRPSPPPVEKRASEMTESVIQKLVRETLDDVLGPRKLGRRRSLSSPREEASPRFSEAWRSPRKTEASAVPALEGLSGITSPATPTTKEDSFDEEGWMEDEIVLDPSPKSPKASSLTSSRRAKTDTFSLVPHTSKDIAALIDIAGKHFWRLRQEGKAVLASDEAPPESFRSLRVAGLAEAEGSAADGDFRRMLFSWAREVAAECLGEEEGEAGGRPAPLLAPSRPLLRLSRLAKTRPRDAAQLCSVMRRELLERLDVERDAAWEAATRGADNAARLPRRWRKVCRAKANRVDEVVLGQMYEEEAAWLDFASQTQEVLRDMADAVWDSLVTQEAQAIVDDLTKA